MADDLSVRIPDDGSHCRLPDGQGGTNNAKLIEVSLGGARIDCTTAFETDAYIDVTLALKGMGQRNFFAHVRESGAKGLRIQWMHIDPGEQRRLRELLEAYRTSKLAKAADRHTSRRIVRPGAFSAGEITPFSAPPGETETAIPIFRSVQPPAEPASDAPAAAAPAKDALDDSRSHHVVVAPTDRFDRLPAQVGAGEPHIAPAAHPAAADHEALPDPEGEALPGKQPVVGADGRMDIGASIRSRAKTVRASELAARHDHVRVLNLATIKALIVQAVEEAANHLGKALGEAERKRLLEEAEENFQERLKEFQAQKLDAEARSHKLQEQLDQARNLLESERKRQITADQFTVSDKGLEDIEGVFRRLIDRSASDGRLDPGLEDQLRKVSAHVLDEERQRIRAKEMQAQNDKIDLLEKKIRRLSVNLEETERQRDEAREIATHLEKFAGQGLSVEQIKNKYQAGLKKDDPNRERKLAIMKELIEENRELRRALGLALNAPTPETALAATPEAEAEPKPEPATEAGTEDDGAAAAPEVNPDDLPWEPEAAEPAVNPDDLPWEPPAPAGEAPAAAGGIKRIGPVRKDPPPLQRS